MIGAGVFAAFGPTARAAGTGLLVGLMVAAVFAYCNAVASAQLAAAYPTSGGTYIYGRERLGHWCGFSAEWGFIAGKTAPRRDARMSKSPVVDWVTAAETWTGVSTNSLLPRSETGARRR